jgi:myo-inositol-1(or 4)-monophosphatase
MRDFVEKLIRDAGALSLEYRQHGSGLGVQAKGASEKDIVTDADIAIETLIRNRIASAWPDHAIIGEERGETPGSESCWIIDPIDGTASYAHGQYHFAVSIAFVRQGVTQLGAIYAPALDDLYLAEKGGGAICNGRPIQVSCRDALDECIMGTGFACLRDNWTNNNLPLFNALAPMLRGIRRFGSAALDLAYVACGQLDAYWELNLNHYDVAAGILLVQEAGGTVTDFHNTMHEIPREILASNGVLHRPMINIMHDLIDAYPDFGRG